MSSQTPPPNSGHCNDHAATDGGHELDKLHMKELYRDKHNVHTTNEAGVHITHIGDKMGQGASCCFKRFQCNSLSVGNDGRYMDQQVVTF
jgi:hypothetical protein